ncbi:MAG: hypothetical protein LQ350_005115 [Teloschistes chrysophthalmus]|nr:MAG: hypothetical protein LQ350_005115 [Niorma chrysophthalma]
MDLVRILESRAAATVLEEEKRAHKAEVAHQLEQQRDVLDRLRAWYRWDESRHTSPGKYLLSYVYSKRPPCPSRKELVDLATFFFPPRSKLMVTICDHGIGRHEEISVPFGQVEQYLTEKPQWVALRWIHLPVGPGLVQSSVEDTFLNAGPPPEPEHRPFMHTRGGLGFRIEVLNIRDQQYLQDQLDVFNMLSSLSQLKHDLNNVSFKDDTNSNLLNDVAWRAYHMKFGSGFWDIVHSDLPRQLGEGTQSSLFDSDISMNPLAARLEEQLLSQHPRYKGTVLVRDPLSLCYRPDGFILTISPPMGVHHLHTSMLDDIRLPPAVYDRLGDYSALQTIRQELAQLTSLGSPELFMKRFIVLIITELVVSPHCFRSGNTPELRDAYRPIARDLKSRRPLDLKHLGTVDLVRKYVTCLDEISQIHDICHQHLRLLSKLMLDCEDIERYAADQGESLELKEEESSTDRVSFATRFLQETYDQLPVISKDLRSSLDVIFQLKTIEQNELAILAESNNKAILAFTIVTIIFLPLSFFSGYFGMNLQGVVNTERTERYFWAVCGTATVCVVSATIIFGFKERIYRWLWTNRMQHPGTGVLT